MLQQVQCRGLCVGLSATVSHVTECYINLTAFLVTYHFLESLGELYLLV